MRHHRHNSHIIAIAATAVTLSWPSMTSSALQYPIPPNVRINLPESIASLFGGGDGISLWRTGKKATKYGDVELENRLLDAIEFGSSRRLDIPDEVADLVRRLESSPTSVPRPAIAPELYGRWKLLRTSNADTASPIQRRAVDASRFDIYQDIVVVSSDDDVGEGGERTNDDDGGGGSGSRLIVSQIVEFGNGNRLCVDALASTSAYPLEELTDRVGSGRILGLNVLGVSLIGDEASEDPNRPDSRLRFVFDEGRFEFGNGQFRLPYPVPFRNPLFRDAVKGWIDVTYLSDRVRISRGNKGTTFVLKKVG
ncbi:hypothetical protein ACHAXA_009550 [Cyclostephanos tholiformis]|uniref:Plastid lipid-associated protein/fibrillin conserved domain-containing protein n=1 Tax=Cyclostephanos tholiformis TaxID=382380 RepID=A0ABD3R5C5_9STRA